MSLNQGKRHHTPISVSWYIVRSKNKVWGEVQGLWRVPCQLEKHGTRLGQGSCWNGQKGTISYPMVFESSPSGHFYYTKSTCNMNVFVARPGCSPQNKLAVHCCHHFFPPPLSLHDRKDDVYLHTKQPVHLGNNSSIMYWIQDLLLWKWPHVPIETGKNR